MIDKHRIEAEYLAYLERSEIVGEYVFNVVGFAQHIANLVRQEEFTPSERKVQLAMGLGQTIYSNTIESLKAENEKLKAKIDNGIRVIAFNLAGWEAVQYFDHDPDNERNPANATLILDDGVV